MFKSLTPEFPVADVVETQRYYRDVLGFRIDWLWDDNFGAVSKGEVELFFFKSKSPNPPKGFGCYLFVDNADEIYELYKKKGARVIDELGSKPWGMREFTIEDPNGHFLRIGHGEKRIHEIERFTSYHDS
ncbi:MAG: bleomycin resistance protein [Nitrospiraceae bacterium]